jgi:hypothetical protein
MHARIQDAVPASCVLDVYTHLLMIDNDDYDDAGIGG